MLGFDRRRNPQLWHLLRFLRKYFLFLVSLILFAVSIVFYIEVETQPSAPDAAAPTNGGSE